MNDQQILDHFIGVPVHQNYVANINWQIANHSEGNLKNVRIDRAEHIVYNSVITKRRDGYDYLLRRLYRTLSQIASIAR